MKNSLKLSSLLFLVLNSPLSADPDTEVVPDPEAVARAGEVAKTEAVDSTRGMIWKGFKGFSMSEIDTDLKGMMFWKYEIDPVGFESDSKQNFRGVVFVVNETGEIKAVKAIVSKQPVPDQRVVNMAVDSQEKISEFLKRTEFEKMDQSAGYGLLSKLATAILVRADKTVVNFDISVSQKEKIETLFEMKIKVPILTAADKAEVNAKKIDDFAKAVIRYSLY